jgi:hypothetical protein
VVTSSSTARRRSAPSPALVQPKRRAGVVVASPAVVAKVRLFCGERCRPPSRPHAGIPGRPAGGPRFSRKKTARRKGKVRTGLS